MQPLFYHDHRTGPLARLGALLGALTLAGATICACGRPTPAPPSAARPSADATSIAPTTAAAGDPGQASTPTAVAVERGRAIIEQVRTAGGGPVLTALKSFEATGTSIATGIKLTRQIRVIATAPRAYRQEEASPSGIPVPAPRMIIGLDGDRGWFTGGRLGGDGQSKDAEVAQRAYTRAARQAMAGFVVGVNLPSLIDSGRYTASDLGPVTAGDDAGAWQVQVDGPDGRVGRVLIDPNTHLPRRLIEPPQPGSGGTTAVTDIVFTYSDFQPQAGLQLPRTILRENGNNRTQWSIAKYTVNPKLPARRFSREGR